MKQRAAAVILVAFCTVAVIAATTNDKEKNKDKFGCTTQERKQIILEAISSAKQVTEQNENEQAKFNKNRMRPLTSSQILARGFKRPSQEALKEGRARLLMEDMIHRAESKLMEHKKTKDGSRSDPKVLTEDFRKELFHRPGSLLTETELDLIFEESNCKKVTRRRPRCNQASINTYRTIDGTCNNLKSPLQGAATMPFRRLIPPLYEDGVSSLHGSRQFSNSRKLKGNLLVKSGPFDPPFPSARLISQRIVRNESRDETPITHMVMQWGQFLDHDLDLAPEIEKTCQGCTKDEVCQPIRIPPNDPAFGNRGNNQCLPFRRSLISCTRNKQGSFSTSEQINDITSYLDASQVYGSNSRVAQSLRTFRNGRLKTSARGNHLPVTNKHCLMDATKCYLAGDIRTNEQVGLTAMHTLWMREHNRIAGVLKSKNSKWSDERLYQETRKIIGAMMQKITYRDYLPMLFGQRYFRTLLPYYRGYKRNVDATIPNSFATAAFRHGHSLIRPVFARYLSDLYERGTNRPLNLRDSFFNQKAFLQTNLGAIFRGLVSQNSLQMDESVNSVLTTQLFQKSGKRGLDLVALNIQRQRDHGMAPYTIWRNFCQRQFKYLPLATIESGTTLGRLIKTYGFLDNVDFWLGGISERAIKGGVLGPTFACILSLTFQNLRDGDRFWYENPGVFTPQQRQEINKTSLSHIICDNTAINTIQRNAFLSNQGRVNCRSLPQMNLNRWRERSCYFKVNSNSAGYGTAIILWYKANNVSHVSSGRDVLGTSPICIPMECPSDSIRESVYVYPRYWRGRRRCNRIIVNPRLPYYKNSSYLYWGQQLSQSLIDTNSGIYSSLQSCQAGRAVAVTYRCRSQYEQTFFNTVSNSEVEEIDNTEPTDCTSPVASNCTLPFDESVTLHDTHETNNLELVLTSEDKSDTKVMDDFNDLQEGEEDARLINQQEETFHKLE